MELLKKYRDVVTVIVAFSLVILILHIDINRQPNYSLQTSIKMTIPNVVHIKNNTGQWQGSGVLVAPDLVLTARHVADSGEDFTVMTNDGKTYKAERAISSKKYDLGFIKLKDRLPCSTRVGSVEELTLGDTIYAIGSPFGDTNFNSVTSGIVSSLHRNFDNEVPSYGWSCVFQTDTAGHPGNSGCPVYNLRGEVVGILVGGMSNSVIYCIPAELVNNDCQVIQLMFLMDEYQKEVNKPQAESLEALRCH